MSMTQAKRTDKNKRGSDKTTGKQGESRVDCFRAKYNRTVAE
jgi:hypothetical protein